MNLLPFTKMNGAGNDFVMVDNRQLDRSLSAQQIAALCDRHRGIGADGLLAVEPAAQGAMARMRYYNADGGEAEMCGNGARCFARYVNSLHGGNLAELSFETMAGLIGAELIGDQVRLKMSPPHGLVLGTKLTAGSETLEVHFINTGVPHAVVLVDDLAKVPVVPWGAALRYHEHFQPKGTNANFAQVLEIGSIAIRTYERGVEDETLACGTGMVACALVHHLLHGAAGPVKVAVKGGDILEIGFQRVGENFENVTLQGPADFTFQGTVQV